MANGIYAALSGALTNMQRLEVVSHNMANASTPAFKLERLASEGVAGRDDKNGELTFSMPAVSETDLRQGPLVATDNPLDLAFAEGGYLAVDNQGRGRIMIERRDAEDGGHDVDDPRSAEGELASAWRVGRIWPRQGCQAASGTTSGSCSSGIRRWSRSSGSG